jgi:transcriptional regulator with XRE-family HTH domain
MSKRMTDARIYKMRAERVMSLDEVAKKMNMSRAEVRQAEMRHIQAMRNAGIIGDETDKEKLARKIYERRMANKESLEQVARDLGMKREQVRQLEMRHAAKLRDSQEKMDAIIIRGGGNPKGRRVSGSMGANDDPRKRVIPASQFTRSQNQAIDWARKQTGFRIARSIIERFDKNKALVQADIDKLQQLMKDYGPG